MDRAEYKVFKEQCEVNNRLDEMGLNQDIRREVAEAAHLAFVSSSENDPAFIPGTNAWSRAVRHLRNRLLMIGWRKDDPSNYAITISDEHTINIIVASGDNCTGTMQTPKTKSVKGIKTELAIPCN